jgi:apolipoprotein N-acyltransferase
MANDREPERPRVEPEIIPPDRSGRGSDWGRSPWRSGGYGQTRGTQRIYVARLGPFGLALLILAIAAIVAIVLIAMLGAVLIWIPVVAVLVVVAALFRLLRR